MNDGGLQALTGPVDAPASEIAADTVTIDEASTCKQLFSDHVVRTGPGCAPATAFVPPLIVTPAAACGYPPVFPGCDASRPISVGSGATRQLAPGVYGSLDVTGTLVLAPGTYVFCSVRTGRSADVRTQEPVDVFVPGDVSLGPSTFTGPASGAGGSLRVITNGFSVEFARGADVTALLCAPNADLRVTASSDLRGTFLARTIYTERIMVHPSTTSTTLPGATTTTLPGGGTTTTSLPSATTTTLPGGTTTTSLPGTTTTTLPGGTTTTSLPGATTTTLPGGTTTTSRPGATTTTIPSGTTTTIPGGTTTTSLPGVTTTTRPAVTTTTVVPSTTTSTTIPTCQCEIPPAFTECVPTGPEICGDCVDNDCNGLVDFEDPACCAPQQLMTIARAQIRRRGEQSRLFLRSSLGAACSDVIEGPLMDQSDLVQLQLRTENQELLCARIPADKFMRMGKTRTAFWDLKERCSCAERVQDTAFACRHGRMNFYARGPKVDFTTPSTSTIRVTVGLRSTAGPVHNFCSTVSQAFRTKRNALVFP